MCGRFVLFVDSEFYPRFHLANAVRINPRYNISPSQDSWIILKRENSMKVSPMRWGFEMRSKNTNIQNRFVFNARVETIDTKYIFKKAFKTQRCIVPASGYYEWKKEGKKKLPYYIFNPYDRYISMAGIFREFEDNEGRRKHCFCVVTTRACEKVSDIHERMPFILRKDQENKWLDSSSLACNTDFQADSNLAFYQVSLEVNSPRNDYEELISPL